MFKPVDGESYYKDMRKEDIERGGKIKCLVCGKSEFAERDNFDSCPVCYWEMMTTKFDTRARVAQIA